jgi:hypothetical protein
MQDAETVSSSQSSADLKLLLLLFFVALSFGLKAFSLQSRYSTG